MKSLFGVLLLLICGPAFAQSTCTGSWCIADVAVTVNGKIVPGVPVGGTVTIAVTYSSTVDQTGVTLGVSILDPSKNQLADVGLWQPGVNLVANQPMAGNSFTFTPSTPGTYTIEAGIWASDGTNPLWDPAVETFAVTAAAPAWTPLLPQCLPKKQWPMAEADDVIPAQAPPVSTRYSNYSVWVCQLPNGYQTYIDLFNPDPSVLAVVWSYLKGTWTLAMAQADCMQTCVQPTASEAAFQQALLAKYRPTALVGYSPLSATRAVYGVNPDGTVSAAIANESVAVATRCNEADRIAGTAYYSVAGQRNAKGGTLPPGSYSNCTITFPISPN